MKAWFLLLLLLLPGPFCLQRPAAPAHLFEYSQVHMGMPVRLLLHAPDERSALEAARMAFGRISALEEMMSDYRPDSELRRLEHRPGERVGVSPELFHVLRTALDIARITDGAFDPTVGPLVALWRAARREQRLPDDDAIRRARAAVGWRRIHLDSGVVRLDTAGMRLDLGGIAKGYILQEALRTLRARSITAALVEAGGDVVVGDAPPGRAGWTIAAPGSDPAFAQRAVALTNAALATSGPSSQFVKIDGTRYSHVVDPRTGLGVTSARTVHVIARDAAVADAAATALGVTGPAGLAALQSAFPDLATTIVETQSPPPDDRGRACGRCRSASSSHRAIFSSFAPWRAQPTAVAFQR